MLDLPVPVRIIDAIAARPCTPRPIAALRTRARCRVHPTSISYPQCVHLYVEALELRRVPDTDDLIGSYEAELDETGELPAYRRVGRYSHCHTQVQQRDETSTVIRLGRGSLSAKRASPAWVPGQWYQRSQANV